MACEREDIIEYVEAARKYITKRERGKDVCFSAVLEAGKEAAIRDRGGAILSIRSTAHSVL